jgi:hypothetical protein
MQSSMEDAARAFQGSVDSGVSEAESGLNKLAQEAQQAADSGADAPAPRAPASESAQPGAPAPAAGPQLPTQKV